jgi:hypothetical protein
MCTNIVDERRSQTNQYVACALYCWINKARKTHSEYVTLNIFHGNDDYTKALKSYFVCTSTVFLNTTSVDIRTFYFSRLIYSCYIYTLNYKASKCLFHIKLYFKYITTHIHIYIYTHTNMIFSPCAPHDDCLLDRNMYFGKIQ